MRIAAFVDRSIYARSVVDHAAWLARASGAGVDLVQIVSPNELIAATMPPIHPGGPVVLPRGTTLDQDIAALHEEGIRQLERSRVILLAAGITDVRTRVEEGDVPRLLADAASSASIVIMGKRGEHADLARLPLGSTFDRMISTTNTPVLGVSRLFRPIDRTLLALGLDEQSSPAIETLGAGIFPPMPVEVLHVGEASQAVRVELDRAASQLSAAGHQPTTEVVDGVPLYAVPERVVSDGIGLVALGRSARSGLLSRIFSNLTRELTRACQVPVLLCR
jgi:nucleotide-binding universal stress UspA family protein